MIDLLPRQAPRTWRGFLLRVAAIALAALIVFGAIGLFEQLQDSRTRHPIPSEPRTPANATPGSTP